MSSHRTRLTEVGTAVGMADGAASGWVHDLSSLEVPGLPREVWAPVVVPVANSSSSRERDLLLRALDNGRAFRHHVLRGRRPDRIEWSGASRQTWTSDIPRDLTVDGVWFIQAKFDSTCVLNTSPAAVVDSLLADDGVATRRSWYEEVALEELQDYYAQVRLRVAHQRHGALSHDDELPRDVRDLTTADRGILKSVLRATAPDPREDEAYARLCHAVSVETARRWEHRLRASTAAQRTQLVLRMLRIAGGPYWVLGVKGTTPIRLSVTDARTWREHHTLRSFDVRPARAGQPQVDWRAEIRDAEGTTHHIDGCCEIRWSHGKLSGNPECKVQVHTPMAGLPGYGPMAP